MAYTALPSSSHRLPSRSRQQQQHFEGLQCVKSILLLYCSAGRVVACMNSRWEPYPCNTHFTSDTLMIQQTWTEVTPPSGKINRSSSSSSRPGSARGGGWTARGAGQIGAVVPGTHRQGRETPAGAAKPSGCCVGSQGCPVSSQHAHLLSRVNLLDFSLLDHACVLSALL